MFLGSTGVPACRRHRTAFLNDLTSRLRLRVCDLRTDLLFQPEPKRLSTALVLSLCIHALLLSITLGGHVFGLPGLHLPWDDRHGGANELRILLAPVPAPAVADASKPEPAVV